MGLGTRETGHRQRVPLFPNTRFAPLWIWIGFTAAWMLFYFVYGIALIGRDFFDAAVWAGGGVTGFQDALLVGYLPAATVWGQRQGACGYLTKPVDERTLISAVNGALA